MQDIEVNREQEIMSYKLLDDDYTLIIQPRLASKIGLNEAIILQQIGYWEKKYAKDQSHYIDGRIWIWNSYRDWAEQFPFWSISTIRRAIKSLIRQELVITGNYNKMKQDKTIWYGIKHERLGEIILTSPSNPARESHVFKMNSPCVQNEQMHVSNLNKALPKTTSKTSSKRIFVTRDKSREDKKFSEEPFLLRSNEGEFDSFYHQIEDMIRAENSARPNNPFKWLPKNGSLQGDLKMLVYGNLRGCRTIEETDKKKESLLYELYNQMGNKLNWLNFVMCCLSYTVITSRRKSVTNPLGFTTSLLYRPATIAGALSDGILSKEHTV